MTTHLPPLPLEEEPCCCAWYAVAPMDEAVTSVQAALLAASKSRSFCFLRRLLLLRCQPRFLASAMFLAALRSARLCRRLRLDELPWRAACDEDGADR